MLGAVRGMSGMSHTPRGEGLTHLPFGAKGRAPEAWPGGDESFKTTPSPPPRWLQQLLGAASL